MHTHDIEDMNTQDIDDMSIDDIDGVPMDLTDMQPGLGTEPSHAENVETQPPVGVTDATDNDDEDTAEFAAMLEQRDILFARYTAKRREVVATFVLAYKISEMPAMLRLAMASEVLHQRNLMLAGESYGDLDAYCVKETGKSLMQEAEEVAQDTNFLDALRELVEAQKDVEEAFDGSGMTSYVEDLEGSAEA